MYILAKLVFKNYVPLKLEQGMLFISKQTDTVYGKVYEYLQLHTLVYIPRDKESYINENGFPVEPYIIAQNQNLDDKELENLPAFFFFLFSERFLGVCVFF
mgnify:CR=1 FL=1